MWYSLVSYGMYLIFLLASPFHKKAKKWIAGRKNYFQELEKAIPPKDGKRVWVHCASLGEFEQVKPIMEKWLEANKDWNLILTFFSPSGYEIRKKYELAAWVGYMALDTRSNASKYLDLIEPDMVLFVKYEFWYFHLTEVIKRKIPIYLISATFRKEHYIFKKIGRKTKRVLMQFSQIFLQNQASYDLLKVAGFNNITVSGDTRYDRVLAQANMDVEIPKIEEWKDQQRTIVLGSSWSEEENRMVAFLKQNKKFKVIVAPHDIGLAHIKKIESLFSFTTCCKYSDIDLSTQVLIIDSIGILSKLYKYGDIAVIGGGFGRGLHNILEPMAFGLPTFFGNIHSKYPEAKKAVEEGVGFELKDSIDLPEGLPSKDEVKNYIKKHSGATVKVLEHINLGVTG